MKFKNKEWMVIRGASIASPEFTTQAEVIATALLRVHGERPPQPGEGARAEALPPELSGAEWAAHGAPSPLLVLLSVPPTTALADTAGPAGHLETWVPLWRSTDSLSLLGESGVLQVGVNDLGWVVYDWIPGP